MVDAAYTDDSLAALYDLRNPWGPSDDFYLDLVMSAQAVLDVGCGTGALLRRARERGHAGRLCGLDPAEAMLARARARARADVEWVRGDLASVAWDREFDLVVMTGHVFQVFVEDGEIRTALAAVWAALRDGGRFAFETRNPSARPWERWRPDNATEVTDSSGVVRIEHEVVGPVTGKVVQFTETFSSSRWGRPRVSRSSLRFLDAASLSSFLSEAGLHVQERFGDWARRPFTETSPEIITVARRGNPTAHHPGVEPPG